MSWANVFLSPGGRINRQTFWIAFAILFVATIVTEEIGRAGQLLGFLLLWPQIVVNVKRLHDMGHTGWWILLPFVVTIACIIAALVSGDMALMEGNTSADVSKLISGALVFILIPVAVYLAFLAWVGFSSGTAGDNRYGPQPA